MRFRTGSLATVLFAFALAGTVSEAPRLQAASRRPATAARGMIVAPEREAAEAGLEVLRGGGNAIDAAVATAFALAVTYPRAGNLGGGGFLLYRRPAGSHEALDFRETAPAGLTPALFLDASGKVDPGNLRRRRSGRYGNRWGTPGGRS